MLTVQGRLAVASFPSPFSDAAVLYTIQLHSPLLHSLWEEESPLLHTSTNSLPVLPQSATTNFPLTLKTKTTAADNQLNPKIPTIRDHHLSIVTVNKKLKTGSVFTQLNSVEDVKKTREILCQNRTPMAEKVKLCNAFVTQCTWCFLICINSKY